jgi:glycosyltransferase involved in cell wall biosynthesis
MNAECPLVFVHEDKACYPEIEAYRTFFSERHGLASCVAPKPPDDCGKRVIWHIMGFYPKRPRGGFFRIHDYRSLSVGALPWLKDRIKRYGNYRPELRIFQNERMANEMGFADGVPRLLLPMGVPDSVLRYKTAANAQTEFKFDFIYIGEISIERGFDAVIESFFKHAGNSRTLLAVGPIRDGLDQRFAGRDNVVFTGRVTQEEVFALIAQTRVCVCYFPYHRPHCFQTPTKLLEYAALGKPILANDAPSNLETVEKLGIRAHINGRDIFAGLPSLEGLPPNSGFDAQQILWPRVIQDSGVEGYVTEFLGNTDKMRD